MSGSQTLGNIKMLDVEAAQLVVQSSSLAINSLSNAEGELLVLHPQASWRQQPASQAQVSFVGAMIGTSYETGATGTLETHIPAGWIGRDWNEQVAAKTMTAGQASDTLDRVIWGIEMLVRKFEEQGMLRPRRNWFGVGEECDAALEQSRDLEKALRSYYFAWDVGTDSLLDSVTSALTAKGRRTAARSFGEGEGRNPSSLDSCDLSRDLLRTYNSGLQRYHALADPAPCANRPRLPARGSSSGSAMI